jgi:hypothetical protein
MRLSVASIHLVCCLPTFFAKALVTPRMMTMTATGVNAAHEAYFVVTWSAYTYAEGDKGMNLVIENDDR